MKSRFYFFSLLLLTTTQLHADPECRRYPICPDAKDFELIKLTQTDHPYYKFRDNHYLCFYLAKPEFIKAYKNEPVTAVLNAVLESFDQFGGGQIQMLPMPLPGGPKEIQRYLGQLRLYRECTPAPALITSKVWKESGDLIYIDVKHTPNR